MALVIDVVSDIVCPWCYIGTTRLEKVLASMDLGEDVQINYRPFELQPNTPPEGTNVHDMLKQRYGRDPKEMFASVEAAAKTSGLALDLSKQRFSYPTIAGHTLIRHAAAKGTQRAFAQALFHAHFDEAKNVSDIAVLADVAAQHGFTVEEATRIATDPKELAITRNEASTASRSGIRGVPYFVFNGAVALSGGQPEATFRDAIRKALATPAA